MRYRKLAVFTGTAVLVILGWFYFFRTPGEALLETTLVQKGDVVQEVDLSGKVKAAESVDLGFDRSGRISKVNASVGSRVTAGQTLAEITNADLASDLLEAQANLKSEEATLTNLKNGAREEDVNVSKAKVEDAKQKIVDSIEEAATKSDDAIYIKIDQLFSNPRSTNPQINISVSSQLESDLESGRIFLGNKFAAWTTSLAKLDVEADLNVFAAEADAQLRYLKEYLDSIAMAVAGLLPAGNLTQTTINGYKTDISTARTNINAAINGVSGATSDLKIAETELSQAMAGSTPAEIEVQEAQVIRAKASVENIRAQISKTKIVSPIAGVVTKQDAKVGQIVSASMSVISVISDAKFEVEANLPEADVAKVKVGNDAKITLDAYGENVVFDAKVASIDPAETIVEGVSTYRITIAFTTIDERIKSGLTANIKMLTAKKEGVLYIPQRAVFTLDGEKHVRIQNPDGRADEIKVVLGLLGSDGRVEIISGIDEGARVITSSTQI